MAQIKSGSINVEGNLDVGGDINAGDNIVIATDFANMFWQDGKTNTGYSRTGARTFTVTDNADNQALFKPGRGLRYSTNTDGTSLFFGVVHSYSTGTVTITGAAQPATVNLLHVAPDFKTTMMHLNLPGELTTDTNYLRNQLNAPFIWRGSEIYILGVDTYVGTAAAGGSGITFNIGIGSTSTQLNSSDYSIGTSTSAFFTDITETSNYNLQYGEEVFVDIATVGSTTAGSDLVVELLGLYP